MYTILTETQLKEINVNGSFVVDCKNIHTCTQTTFTLELKQFGLKENAFGQAKSQSVGQQSLLWSRTIFRTRIVLSRPILRLLCLFQTANPLENKISSFVQL
jgi:hypothetical protein